MDISKADVKLLEDKLKTQLAQADYENISRINNELINIRREIERKNSELQKLNEEKNILLGIVAHDLRNPLSGIIGIIDLLESNYNSMSDKNIYELLSFLKESAKNMLEMVNQLLDISMIESGKLKLNYSLHNYQQVISDKYQYYKVLAAKKDIRIKLDIENNLPEVYFDIERINEVLYNLISNAIKFSFPATEIIIRIYLEQDFIVTSVIDQGPGIPVEEQNMLFKEFQKTSVKPTQDEISTGLGLAIVKKVVNAHQGEIGVRSQINAGSEFYFKLPLKRKK